MRILTGDIGATKTDLCLFEGDHPERLEVSGRRRYESAAYSGLVPIVGDFLRGERVDAAGFGAAGPVMGGVCRTTNLPWVIQSTALERVCGTPYVALFNDVQAAALAVPAVEEQHLVWLQRAPVDPCAPIELVAVGTGLGRAFVIPGVGAFPTESGHASFAARNIIERRLLAFAAERFDPLAIEHLLSGMGLKVLYDFVVEQGLAAPTAQLEIDRADDPSARIGSLGVRDLDPASAATVALFADLLGAELGNIALRSLPYGGLYLWGGVARRLRAVLERGELLDAFLDKDRMDDVLRAIPLALIDAGDLAILGAKQGALHALQTGLTRA